MQIVWGDAARREFDAAIAFIRSRSPAGAMRVGERILAAVTLLERFPELAPPSRHRELRQLVVPRTPYLVIYRIHENRIEIRAVVHTKQRRRK
jgi:toxin ParE1/3/4